MNAFAWCVRTRLLLKKYLKTLILKLEKKLIFF
jgi:hypothetical protein